ncbi:hypothetical protein LMG28688_04273 [Paraburkholderia caffeinitolerans]|uniref:Uncharacterized protein n=1 Tax=Paraburkholderia caffeinitolerans TaxID=1723730 RepID=A0A6J5GCT9_9BURK|nr:MULTISPECIES: hypothetical protein [Paraburkholderia]CAB3796272.1 hypothetical protein LMG28688_04273 [Paraburkholderia caffeinitolerans]
MANVPMRQVMMLAPGMRISAKHVIDVDRVRHWRYANECPPRFAPVVPPRELEIFEVHKAMVEPWIKAWLPHTHDTMYLKIAGSELSSCFYLVE